MNSVFRTFYTVLFLMSLVTVSYFQASGQDREKFVFEPIVGNGRHVDPEENILTHLLFKLIICTQNQTKCDEFDELTTQIESNFAKGNHSPEKNEQYIKLREAYNQLKFTQEENHLNFGEDSHLFQPRFKKLTEEEKKIPFKERFAKKYIGKIPVVVDAIMFYLQNYEELSKTQLQAPNQILLYGSPATGKTHLVKTIVEELELPIIEIDVTTFSNKYYEERSFQSFFEKLEKRDKLTTVFIDDIDIIANTYSKERAILLTELENIKNNKKVFIFCATNNINNLDPALKSRFTIARINQLSDKERAQLFKKSFADNGEIIDNELATMLAEVTSEKRFSESVFDNRDIGNIAIFTLIKQQRCLKKNSETGKCFQTCKFAEEAIRQMDKSKWAKFGTEWKKWCYKDNTKDE